MSWWIIPVKLETIEAQFRADRRLAFQVLTAFGSKNQQAGPSRVLHEADDGRRLVEFTSETGRPGKTAVTHEWVAVDEPGEIRFSGVKGPLQHLEDRFTLEDDNGCTQFRYESSIGVRGWWFGWLIARFYAKAIVEHMMRTHVPEMKEAIENRASRSSLFPQTGCASQIDQIPDGALATSSA